MEKLERENHNMPHEIGSKDMPIPEPFRDINPLVINSKRMLPTILLESCSDHYIMLIFYGIVGKENKEIILMSRKGATLDYQSLWSEKG